MIMVGTTVIQPKIAILYGKKGLVNLSRYPFSTIWNHSDVNPNRSVYSNMYKGKLRKS